MERLSRHFAGRIRRNLSQSACISRSSLLARDVLSEFKTWRAEFEKYTRHHATPDDQPTLQQAELAWNFTCITFTGGVLSSDPSIYDEDIYTPYYTRINDLAEQRFTHLQASKTKTSDTTTNANPPIKAFLQIIIPSLWLNILMCRVPTIRHRTINILKSTDHQEGEFNSLITASIAEVIVDIETRGLPVIHADQIPLDSRIQIEGIKYIPDTQELLLSYSAAIETNAPSVIIEKKIHWLIPGDLLLFNNAVLALSQSCTLYRKVRSYAAPGGCVEPMVYRGGRVDVCLDGDGE